jgi:hypothetical protein
MILYVLVVCSIDRAKTIFRCRTESWPLSDSLSFMISYFSSSSSSSLSAPTHSDADACAILCILTQLPEQIQHCKSPSRRRELSIALDSTISALISLITHIGSGAVDGFRLQCFAAWVSTALIPLPVLLTSSLLHHHFLALATPSPSQPLDTLAELVCDVIGQAGDLVAFHVAESPCADRPGGYTLEQASQMTMFVARQVMSLHEPFARASQPNLSNTHELCYFFCLIFVKFAHTFLPLITMSLVQTQDSKQNYKHTQVCSCTPLSPLGLKNLSCTRGCGGNA